MTHVTTNESLEAMVRRIRQSLALADRLVGSDGKKSESSACASSEDVSGLIARLRKLYLGNP